MNKSGWPPRGWDKFLTAMLGMASFASFTAALVILFLVFAKQGMWEGETPAPMAQAQKAQLSSEKLEALEALENIEQNLIELNSQIQDYIMTGKEFHAREFEDIQEMISLYVGRYRDIATSDSKTEFHGDIHKLMKGFERNYRSLQMIHVNRNKAMKNFEATYDKIITVIEEARKIAEWRVQMAMRRSSISQESSLKTEFEDTLPVLNAVRGVANSAGKMVNYLNKYLITFDENDKMRYQSARKRLQTFVKGYSVLIKVEGEEKIVLKLKRYRDQMDAWGRRAVRENDEIRKKRVVLSKANAEIKAVLKQARSSEMFVPKSADVGRLRIEQKMKKQYIYEFALLVLALFVLCFLFIRSRTQMLFSRAPKDREKSDEIANLELQLELIKLKLETPGQTITGATREEPTVLVIDNDIDFVRDISGRLRNLNFKVFRVYDESQGILEALRLKPDIILADAMVSVHDNYELLKKLKRDQPNIPIIVMHGEGIDLEVLRWAPISFDKVISKTHTHDVLQAVIKELQVSRSEKDERGHVVASRNILIIESDPKLRKLFKEMMSSWHYPFIAVKSGKEALTLMNPQTFDLILMDVSEPGAKSVQVYKEMKALQPKATCIIMSDRPDIDTFEALERNGALVGIAKPFKLEDLHEIIEFFFSHDPMIFANWFKKTADLYKHAENFKHNKKWAA